MNVLALDNVSYSYDKKNEVLKQVNISFQAGKLYVIMGKSGAGKSTLLSLLSGLDHCRKGTFLYRSNNLEKMDRYEYRRKEIGILFQGYNLLNNATVLDNVMLPMDISGRKIAHKKQRAFELLEKVGIDRHKAVRKTLKLSGGEQQRVAIAAAIAHDPAVIIADEPTGNLDSDTEKAIMELLTGLAVENGKCVIVVTHSKAASEYADELWGLNKGRLNIIKKINLPSQKFNQTCLSKNNDSN